MQDSINPVPESSQETSDTAPTASPYMQNRELSWLSFNERVLDVGADETVPLLERLNFTSIFWSNLQEFFMVRVGSITDLSLVKKPIYDNKTLMTPHEQLDAIYTRCHELYPIYEKTFQNICSELSRKGITQLQFEDIDEKQEAYLHDYLNENVIPFLSPQVINPLHPFPHLENGALYVIVRLDELSDPKKKSKSSQEAEKPELTNEKSTEVVTASTQAATKTSAKKKSKNLGAKNTTLGIIPFPLHAERIIPLPGDGFQFILLEQALELLIPEIFSMYTVKHTNIICVTRNADLDASEGDDEIEEDYREHMKRILKKRSRLAPVRLESERPLSNTVSKLLLKRLELKPHQAFVTEVPLDMSYTYELSSFISKDLHQQLTNPPFTPQWVASLDRNKSIIEQVQKKEVLLNYPYESVEPFIQLLKEASIDPDVISIKITLYRLASVSQIAEALIAAAENGKEVTALFELRARFDESNNIEWSQRFEMAGAKVIYGFRDYKVHSKICCITRRSNGGIEYITQLGTGNYNEKTAGLYTDMAFITTDQSIGRDAMEFFRNMGLENTSDNYDILWVAPLQIKPMIIQGINQQIEEAKQGKPSGLFFKTNSITDKDIIVKLSEASNAGVPVILFVRGISCIVPDIEGFTENVRVVSIVGRLLEHSRIYGFGPQKTMKIYLSSADLMTRNMDKRIEIAWPVLNETLRDEIVGYLDISLKDTAKLRELKKDKTYTPLGYLDENDKDKKLFDSQEYLIKLAQKRRLAATAEEAKRKSDNKPINTEVIETKPVLATRNEKPGLITRLKLALRILFR